LQKNLQMSFSGLCPGSADAAGHGALEEIILSKELGATNDMEKVGRKAFL